ncbi:MAG: RNA polymerase subunit sigma-70 [Lachnospiraceae bacterium]
MTVDKNILRDYIDACELIKETEEDIRHLKRQRKTIVTDSVKGSMPEFPYAAQNFKIAGVSHTVIKNPGELKKQEVILEERKTNAEKIKTQVEVWMNTIPMRMQRIIRMKYFERKTWDKVAKRMGCDVSGDAIRKELESFMKNN